MRVLVITDNEEKGRELENILYQEKVECDVYLIGVSQIDIKCYTLVFVRLVMPLISVEAISNYVRRIGIKAPIQVIP